jgi:hypothetical protein
MPVVRMDALCECEGCGKRFGIEVDLASPTHGDFDALVRELVLSGQTTHYTWGVRGKATVDRLPLPYQPTVQGGLLLCDVCSKICDEFPVRGDLTLEQVYKALGIIGEC